MTGLKLYLTLLILISASFKATAVQAQVASIGDITELKAVGEVFKDSVPKISSTKSLSGHSLGATSVHEAIYSLIMMKNNFISASININDMDDEAKKYPIVTKVEKDVNLNSIMSNSFGFGGTNATLVFEKV